MPAKERMRNNDNHNVDDDDSTCQNATFNDLVHGDYVEPNVERT